MSDPYNIKKQVIVLLKNLYASKDNFIYPLYKLAETIFSDDNTSDIKISGDFLFNSSDTQNVPAIFVGVQDMPIQPMVLNNDTGMDYYPEVKQRTVMFNIPVVISHIARDVDEALLLATNTATFFIAFTEELQRGMDINSLIVGGVSSPKLLTGDSVDRKFVSSVSLQIQTQYVINVQLEQNIIKKIDFENNKY